jgi:hypothetical protein
MSLAVVGTYMRRQKMWNRIEQHVQIKQKTIRHTPTDKLLDALISILSGAAGLVEINTRVRPDRAVQRAFGRQSCAEQSVVSTTLNACTAETVQQMRTALTAIYREHSQGFGHDYTAQYQLLDVDMTGMPAGVQGEEVTKGYFAHAPHTRGRQLGRVSATTYQEVVVDYLYPGKRQLGQALQELVQAAAAVLELDEACRQRTIVRADRGGGSEDDINWLLSQGYVILVKNISWHRAHKLAQSVTDWRVDPRDPQRQAGWVTAPHPYAAITQQIAVRIQKTDGQWAYAVLVSSLPADALAQLVPDTVDPLWATVYAYDLRSGGLETINRNDKQGLGLVKRNKRSFPAQEMLVLLAQFAHNLLLWVRQRLARVSPPLQHFGLLRLVRDVLHVPGLLVCDAGGNPLHFSLAEQHPFAQLVVQAFAAFLARDDMCLNLRQI